MIMNKRFSTLLAAALVAGGLSFNAAAASVDASTLKDGSFIHLTIGSGSTDYLAMDEAGNFKKVEAATWRGSISNLLGTLWQVKLNPHSSVAGIT